MKVVALLSGGKDSIYNLLHCILNGHQPIAVASLAPPNGKDEIDSYMYQTVAHSGLSLVAESLSLPFYTRIINGTPLNQTNSYGSRTAQPPPPPSPPLSSESELLGEEKDETEDMYELLRDLKEKEPTVQGVAVGAILSNYQRVRVEQVCSRLGLVPIAYLWERNQADLLGEMVRAGMESVLVKVAGAGLGVEHLGQSLKQMEPTLHRLNKKYELHICGEGGEYETFTVDCPIYKSRIVFKKTTTIISNPDPYSTVAHLHLDECFLEPKPNHPQNETFEQLQTRLRSLVSVPAMLDRSSLKIYRAVREAYRNYIPLESVSLDPKAFTSDRAKILINPFPSSPTITTIGPWIHFSNLSLSSPTPSTNLPIESEVNQLFESLIELLSQKSSTLLHLTQLTLYLSSESMKLFPRINQVYSTYFGTAPPTRVCVGILLSPSSSKASSPRINLEGIAYNPSPLPPSTSFTPKPPKPNPTDLINFDEKKNERKNVHVQSISYWASANIGPYSQSIIIDRGQSIHLAGQIGLIPKSLELPLPTTTTTTSETMEEEEEEDQIEGFLKEERGEERGEEVFAKETSLSLQHLRKVLIASIGKRRLSCREGREGRGRALNGLCWILRESGGILREEGLGRCYERRLEGAREGWRVGYGVLRRGGEEDALDEEEDEDEEEEEEDEADRVPLLFVSAEALPKGAKIEWQVSWDSGVRDEDDDEGKSEEEDSSIIKEVGRTKWLERDPTTQPSDIVLKYSKTSPSSHLLTILVGGSTTCDDFSQARRELPSISEAGLLSLKVFHRPGVTPEQIDQLVSGLLAPDEVSKPEQRPTTSFICCKHISTLERDVLDVAILMNYVFV